MTKFNFNKTPTDLLCPNGIIAEYLKFTSGHECPDDFQLWCIIGAIAMALGRSTYQPCGVDKLYPNLYIVLVGESALTHKSTAMNLILKPFKREFKDVDFSSQKVTPQALMHRLSKIYAQKQVSELCIHASEMSVLLGRANMDDTILKVLTDFWDCPDDGSVETIQRGMEITKNVCINMLAGSTAEWLRSSVPADSLGGGFFSRVIYVQRPYTGRKIPFMDELFTAERMQYLSNVIHDLRVIHHAISGPMMWTGEARERFRTWYTKENKPEQAEDYIRGYIGRKGDMISKLAMIHSANRGIDRLIRTQDINFGIEQLNKNERFMGTLVRQLGQTEVGRKQMYVLDKIKCSNLADGTIGINRSKLVNKVKHTMRAQELDEIIYSLKEGGQVTDAKINGKVIYYYIGETNE